MNYLAIDYGTIHSGLAISSTSLAEPLKTIPTDSIINSLPEIVSTHHIDHIIIGLPDGKIGESVLAFKAKLESSLSTPITLHDETLTSHDALENLKSAKKKKRSGPDHHYAAALILQDYLDFNT